jgi:hypothetical protein
MQRRVVTLKWTDVSKVLTACIIKAIALMMEAVRTYETSVHFNKPTWRYISEDYKRHFHEFVYELLILLQRGTGVL